MRAVLAIAFAFVVTAAQAETAEDRQCNAQFAAAARYLNSGSPEWKAMAHHSMDLNGKYPDDWTDDKALDTKARHRQDMDSVLGRVESGALTIEKVFADVNACETRLGWPVTTLTVQRQPPAR
ncbi:MAG TPA: hypothetical protein VG889_10085 [Rhizomicrobium sp.]|nr:hypothetical protein [Rhizomicrobium sp.]